MSNWVSDIYEHVQLTLITLRGDAHIDFSKFSVKMTLSGGG